MTRYVALLRGINVGGKSMVKMGDLRKIFSSLGFSNVKTFINSGNVLFDSSKDETVLESMIEKELAKSLREIKTVVRSIDHLDKIIKQFSKMTYSQNKSS